jgi:periodic tryptophan protein 1
MPICIEWLDFDPTATSSKSKTASAAAPLTPVNYIAVGTLNPWIEIWDLDLMDCLEPEYILGQDYDDEEDEQDSKKKKKKKAKLDEEKSKTKKKKKKANLSNGHRDAVLDLAYNRIERTVLASASADKTVVLWDLESIKPAARIKHHKGIVQTLQFHPIESFSLLSGSADSTVALFDCRNPDANKKCWSLSDDGSAEVEKVLWNQFEPNHFLVGFYSGKQNILTFFKVKLTLNRQIVDFFRSLNVNLTVTNKSLKI